MEQGYLDLAEHLDITHYCLDQYLQEQEDRASPIRVSRPGNRFPTLHSLTSKLGQVLGIGSQQAQAHLLDLIQVEMRAERVQHQGLES